MKKLRTANATQLTEQLWIGGELDSMDHRRAIAQLDELTDAGIDAIIDCRIERSDMDWVTEAKPQLEYLHIGVEDGGFVMPDDWFDDGVTFALDEISQGHVVLAHCQAGINRGPTMGFLILISQGCDPIDAMDLIKKRRPKARIAYAEQAIDWWLESTGATDEEAVTQIRRIKKWREVNTLLRSTENDGTWMGF